MSIHSSTIVRLFRESFTAESPDENFVQVSIGEREKLAAIIKQRLSGFNDVTVESDYEKNYYLSEEQKEQFVCEISIKDNTERYYYRSSVNFRLFINELGKVTIKHYAASAVVSNVDEILALIAGCQEAIKRKQTLASKRKKVHHLQKQGVIAQVKKLAQEEKFDFAIESDTVKIKLYVKISEKECAEIWIPFKRFRETLSHLRTTILTLRELGERGVNIKIRSLASSRFGYKNWIEYESG